MKKLYQYNKILIVFIFFLLPFKVEAFENVPGSTCKYAGSGEKVTLTSADISYTSGNYVDYYVPAGTRSEVYKLLCVEGPKYDISGGTLALTGGKIYYPIKKAGFSWRLRDCQGICIPTGETSYTSLDACMSSFTEKYYSSTKNDFYATQTECVTAEASTVGSALSSGGCFFAPPSSGRQTTLVRNAGLTAISDETKCSCATKPDTFGIMTDIFIANPDGSIKATYFLGSSGGSTSSAYSSARDRCFADNTNRFYSPATSRCYSSLDDCKNATSTSALLECDETKKDYLYLVFPPTSKTEITPSDEVTKKTQILDCVKNGRTQEQCFNIHFGAGPTSSTIKKENFYRCTCVQDTSPVCVVAGLASTPCSQICNLNPTGFTNVVSGQKVEINSPLVFIKVLSNFLFYAAIVIFIINFLIAGLAYVKSKGEPEALKTAQARITNSIGGLIFILLVGALLNYLVSRLTSFGF